MLSLVMWRLRIVRRIFGLPDSTPNLTIYVCVDDEGERRDLAVGLAEFANVGFVEREQVVIEDEHADITVMSQQVLDLLDHLADAEPADVVKVLEPAVQVRLVRLDDDVVEAIRAREGTSSRGHQADPAVLGVDQPLKVHALVVLQRQAGQLGQGTDGIDRDPAVLHPGEIRHVSHAPAPGQRIHELRKSIFALTSKDIIEQPGLENLLGVGHSMNAAEDEGNFESRPGPLRQCLRVRPLVGHDGER
jgi:hypothetical protein